MRFHNVDQVESNGNDSCSFTAIEEAVAMIAKTKTFNVYLKTID